MLTRIQDGAVAILTLDYPARRNALALPMRDALLAALHEIDADGMTRAIVLTGAGTTFCAGGDISGMNAADLGAGRARFRVAHAIVQSLIGGRLPVVAAVEGACVGAGLALALCCDTIVAATDAKLAAGFGAIGLVGDFGLLHTLPARVGLGRARQILFYGERIDPAAALAMGLVDQLAAPGTVLAVARARAQTLAQGAPLPVALTKQFLAQALYATLDWERDTQAALFQTADHHEGRTAFLSKRTPVFRGV